MSRVSLPLFLLTLSCSAPSPSTVKVTNGKPVAETAAADKPTARTAEARSMISAGVR